jgi:hypothetical protein
MHFLNSKPRAQLRHKLSTEVVQSSILITTRERGIQSNRRPNDILLLDPVPS